MIRTVCHDASSIHSPFGHSQRNLCSIPLHDGKESVQRQCQLKSPSELSRTKLSGYALYAYVMHGPHQLTIETFLFLFFFFRKGCLYSYVNQYTAQIHTSTPNTYKPRTQTHELARTIQASTRPAQLSRHICTKDPRKKNYNDALPGPCMHSASSSTSNSNPPWSSFSSPKQLQKDDRRNTSTSLQVPSPRKALKTACMPVPGDES